MPLLILDVPPSMRATDVDPSRLDAAKPAAVSQGPHRSPGGPRSRDPAYQNALTRSDRGPELVLRDARNWGAWPAWHGAWTDAAEAFDHANQAATRLFRTRRGELGTAEWLGYTDGLPHWAALAHNRLGDDATVIDAFETGRAVLLRGTEPIYTTYSATP